MPRGTRVRPVAGAGCSLRPARGPPGGTSTPPAAGGAEARLTDRGGMAHGGVHRRTTAARQGSLVSRRYRRSRHMTTRRTVPEHPAPPSAQTEGLDAGRGLAGVPSSHLPGGAPSRWPEGSGRGPVAPEVDRASGTRPLRESGPSDQDARSPLLLSRDRSALRGAAAAPLPPHPPLG